MPAGMVISIEQREPCMFCHEVYIHAYVETILGKVIIRSVNYAIIVQTRSRSKHTSQNLCKKNNSTNTCRTTASRRQSLFLRIVQTLSLDFNLSQDTCSGQNPTIAARVDPLPLGPMKAPSNLRGGGNATWRTRILVTTFFRRHGSINQLRRRRSPH